MLAGEVSAWACELRCPGLVNPGTGRKASLREPQLRVQDRGPMCRKMTLKCLPFFIRQLLLKL